MKESRNYFSISFFLPEEFRKILVIQWYFISFKISESLLEQENSFSENQPFPSLKMVSSLGKPGQGYLINSVLSE